MKLLRKITKAASFLAILFAMKNNLSAEPFWLLGQRLDDIPQEVREKLEHVFGSQYRMQTNLFERSFEVSLIERNNRVEAEGYVPLDSLPNFSDYMKLFEEISSDLAVGGFDLIRSDLFLEGTNVNQSLLPESIVERNYLANRFENNEVGIDVVFKTKGSLSDADLNEPVIEIRVHLKLRKGGMIR